MSKSEAIKKLFSAGYTSLTSSNTIFSNIISQLDSWWLQPENNKFSKDLHIILNDKRVNQFYFFTLPANAIIEPSQFFKQRNDKHRKDCSDIYIPTSGMKFKEKNDLFDFSKFLLEKIEY